MNPEARGLEENKDISFFAKGYHPDGKLIACVLWNTDEDLQRKLSIIEKKILETKDINVLEGKIFSEFVNVLRKLDYNPQGTALHNRKDIWYSVSSPLSIIKEGNSFYRKSEKNYSLGTFQPKKFNIYSTKITDKPSKSYMGFVAITDSSIDTDTLSEKVIWEARKFILKTFLDFYKKKNKRNSEDAKYIEYFETVDRIVNMIEIVMNGRHYENYVFRRLFEYLISFDFIKYNDVIIPKPRLFERKKKLNEFIDELKHKEGKEGKKEIRTEWDDLTYVLASRLEDLIFGKEGAFDEYLKQYNFNFEEFKKFYSDRCEEWLKEFLKEHSFNNNFIKKLRNEWVNILEKPPKGLTTLFLQKDKKEKEEEKEKENVWFEYGKFLLPSNQIDLIIAYEEDYKNKITNIKDAIQKMSNYKEYGKYIGGLKINIVDSIHIKELIPFFDELKEIKGKKVLKTEESEKLLFSLWVFSIKLLKLAKEGKGVLFLLSAQEKDGEGYLIWDYYRELYEDLGIPAQTLNKDVIETFLSFLNQNKNNKEKSGISFVFKNTIISLLKDTKVLKFAYGGISIPEDVKTVYVVLEKFSPKFFYSPSSFSNEKEGVNHCFVKIYRLDFLEGNQVRIGLDRSLSLLYGRLDEDTNEFRSWIEEQTEKGKARFFVITPGKIENSCVKEILKSSGDYGKIEKKTTFVEYKTIPLPYISDKKKDEDCLLVYSEVMREIENSLQQKTESYKHSIGLKAPDSPQPDKFSIDNQSSFYHTSLQVFTTEGEGWTGNENYNKKKGLFLTTIIAISGFLSESFSVPYSKLDLKQKTGSLKLTLNRANNIYRAPLKALLYEIKYLVSKIPI